MLSQRVGDFITLQDMLQRLHPDFEAFERAQQRQDFVLAITVAMDPPLLLKNLDEGVSSTPIRDCG